jgi:glycerophosphoryl diester phosphodiesterase
LNNLYEIIAHRGFAEHAPENTLPVFLMAKELGADVIELDVRLTADDEI